MADIISFPRKVMRSGHAEAAKLHAILDKALAGDRVAADHIVCEVNMASGFRWRRPDWQEAEDRHARG